MEVSQTKKLLTTEIGISSLEFLLSGMSPCLQIATTGANSYVWFQAGRKLPEIFNLRRYSYLVQGAGLLLALTADIYNCAAGGFDPFFDF